MERRRWRDLSPGTRRLIVFAGACETVLKVAALADLGRRPAAEVRGRKWAWATALAVVSSGGVLPAAYFVLGRRRPAATG